MLKHEGEAKQVTKEKPKAPASSRAGAPTKAEEARLVQRVQIMLTTEEYAKIQEGRGGVPTSAYLREGLKRQGII